MEPTGIPKTLMVTKANGTTMNTVAQSQWGRDSDHRYERFFLGISTTGIGALSIPFAGMR
jgi:hypothetical protein